MARKKLSPAQKKERWRKIRKGAMWASLLIGGYELVLATVVRRQKHRDTFNLALRRQSETGKEILVIGDPKGSFVNRILGTDWECGNICIDVRGCATCPSQQSGTIEELSGQFADNSAVVFVSAGELEKTADIRDSLQELLRISGGDLYVVPLERYSLAAWSPRNKRRVLAAPPKTSYTEWKALPWIAGPSTVERLAGLRRIA